VVLLPLSLVLQVLVVMLVQTPLVLSVSVVLEVLVMLVMSDFE